MSETVSDRAAKYFGMFRIPRRSIKVGRRKSIVVARRGSGVVLATYDEEFRRRPYATYAYLTDEQREELIEALTDA